MKNLSAYLESTKHPHTKSLLNAMKYDSIALHDDSWIVLHFNTSKSISLTLEQLQLMSDPNWFEPYKRPAEDFTGEDVLQALRSEFGKEV